MLYIKTNGKREPMLKQNYPNGYHISKGVDDKKQGTLLDISNLTIDPSKVKLRFNKGGLVERPNKK